MSNLYVFVHIPKTAGEAFKRNIEHSLPRGRFLRSSFNYFEPYFDTKKHDVDFLRGRDYFHAYVRSLSPTERNQIQCVGGHDSYFGIHTLFERPSRYITFVRDPIQRTLSLYNFERMAWESRCHQSENLNIFDEGFLKRMTDHFLIDGKVPSFDAWLDQIYGRNTEFYFSMSDFLRKLGFQRGLEQFHFVGITENYERDSLYLYDALGITRFDADRNASDSFIRLEDLTADTLERVKKANTEDTELYRLAVEKNRLFKASRRTHYSFTLAKMRAKRFLSALGAS